MLRGQARMLSAGVDLRLAPGQLLLLLLDLAGLRRLAYLVWR